MGPDMEMMRRALAHTRHGAARLGHLSPHCTGPDGPVETYHDESKGTAPWKD